MILEVLRIATSVIWLLLIILGARSAWRCVRAAPGLHPADALIGAMWVLAVNREAFAAVAEFDPGDPDASALCYVLALIGGLLMLGAVAWARHDVR